MKPHKLKKFKDRTKFTNACSGLSILQLYVVAQSIVEESVKNPDKLKDLVEELNVTICGDRLQERIRFERESAVLEYQQSQMTGK